MTDIDFSGTYGRTIDAESRPTLILHLNGDPTDSWKGHFAAAVDQAQVGSKPPRGFVLIDDPDTFSRIRMDFNTLDDVEAGVEWVRRRMEDANRAERGSPSEGDIDSLIERWLRERGYGPDRQES